MTILRTRTDGDVGNSISWNAASWNADVPVGDSSDEPDTSTNHVNHPHICNRTTNLQPSTNL
ncbi:MAG: hypothetical protein Q8J62_06000 [Candidatus Cloacimonadaceae bacterium]|nr:hypothetical protein [Candidatus Cloacimonadaceae bacterium]